MHIYLLLSLINLKYIEDKKCIFYFKYLFYRLFCCPLASASWDSSTTRSNVTKPLHGRVWERIKRKETRKIVRKKQTEKARKAARKNSENK